MTFSPTNGQAEGEMKIVLTSSMYGIAIGTVLGAASLVMVDQPGENLQNIARGASLGLYAGILLGVYVAYFVSDEEPVQAIRLSPKGQAMRQSPRGLSGFESQKHLAEHSFETTREAFGSSREHARVNRWFVTAMPLESKGNIDGGSLLVSFTTF